jgi:hypothetical protein
VDLIAFVGPSLGSLRDRYAGQIDLRPPAACGDIARAARSHPRAIGLIDGLFETRPSASMGAIRAAELTAFGMTGIGRVFEAYHSGLLEDDDEVAVQHGPAETGYVLLSEAMVNIRECLSRMQHEGLLGGADAELACQVAKALFYKDRTWDRIFEGLLRLGVAQSDLRAAADWLEACPCDIKRDDACALLEAMLAFEAPSRQPALPFPNTLYWEQFRARSLEASA